MFHEDILYISYRKHINISFLISNKNFIWTTLKAILSIFLFFAPSDF